MNTTLPGPSWVRGGRRLEAADVPALVIAWSADEPERVGEVALVPDDGEARVLGRGEGAPESARLELVRQRPGENRAQPPLAGRGVSREHLRVTATDDGGLKVERLGRGDLLVNGVVTSRAILQPGDVATLRHALVLYVTTRPSQLPPRRHLPADGVPAFGAADAHGLVGESEAVWQLRDELAFAAAARGPVLITGESGAGKELVAAAVHRLSPRASQALVARNAATLPEGLIDAELFGNVKDYPNPGMRDRPGLIGEAQGSSLFLDEIGEIPTELQAHLLRLLDGGEYHRLGEARSRRADVRLIAATNRDPTELKHDLAARFTLRVVVPGLGDRREDVPLLTRHLFARMRAENPTLERFTGGDGAPRIHPDVIEHLVRRGYTHHVRELSGLLWQAVQASTGDHVALPRELETQVAGTPPTTSTGAGERAPADPEPTREQIQAAIESHGGNVSLAYRILGLKSRYALYRLMRKHGIER